jgi:protein required for attachment to host cells
MSGLSIREGEWVVVCDGAKALILENAGDTKFPNLKTREVFEHKALSTHELGTDAPGRSFSAVGHGRSSVSQTDFHLQEEETFLADLAAKLDHAVTVHEVKSLIVVAPPRALGFLRQAYGHGVKAAVRAEIDKDLVKMPVHEIEKYLTA